MKRILCVFVAALMLAGLAACSASPAADQINEQDTATVPQLISYAVYVPNDNADGFHVITASGETVSAETVLAELKKQNVLPEAISLNSFHLENGLITMDLNQAFADIICSMGTSGELMIVGSVVNTFLEAFQAESVSFTVDGEILESGHTIYDFPLSFFSMDP